MAARKALYFSRKELVEALIFWTTRGGNLDLGHSVRVLSVAIANEGVDRGPDRCLADQALLKTLKKDISGDVCAMLRGMD
jgi:hypothetical protein